MIIQNCSFRLRDFIIYQSNVATTTRSQKCNKFPRLVVVGIIFNLSCDTVMGSVYNNVDNAVELVIIHCINDVQRMNLVHCNH